MPGGVDYQRLAAAEQRSIPFDDLANGRAVAPGERVGEARNAGEIGGVHAQHVHARRRAIGEHARRHLEIGTRVGESADTSVRSSAKPAGTMPTSERDGDRPEEGALKGEANGHHNGHADETLRSFGAARLRMTVRWGGRLGRPSGSNVGPRLSVQPDRWR